jgi:hypothetical protein
MSNLTPEEPTIGTQQANGCSPRRATLFASVLLFALVLGVFWPALSNGFVGYDDPDYVTENDHVRAGLTWESVQWAFRSTEAANWHPLTRLSHMLDCQLYGLAPWGHHLTSILLHALNATLLFLVLRRMTGAAWRSFAVGLLFGLHPLRVESVAWIAERKDVLSTLFWLLTLWAYVRYVEKSVVSSQWSVVERRASSAAPDTTPGLATDYGPRTTDCPSRFTFHVSGFYLLSLLLFILGLMSKPMVVTLPCVLLLLDYWPLKRMKNEECRMKNAEPGTSSSSSFILHHSSFWRRSRSS